MKRLLIAALGAAALAAAPSAAAKTCVRIDAPATVEAGRTIQVAVRVYLPTWRRGRVVKLKPLTRWPSRLELAVTGPNGRLMRLETSGARDGVGVVRVFFPVAGSWRLDAVGWEYAPPTCAPSRLVRVVEPT